MNVAVNYLTDRLAALLVICAPRPTVSTRRVGGVRLMCLLLCPQSLEPCLARDRCAAGSLQLGACAGG